jgi:hypothetical protein
MRCASLLETVTEKSATPVPLAAIKGRRTNEIICLRYYDKSKHDAMTGSESRECERETVAAWPPTPAPARPH